MVNPKRARAGGASPKRAVNLTIDAKLLEEARAAGTNVSAVLEAALEKELAEYRLQSWRDENREAIDDYNRFIEENGLLSDEWRSF